MATTIRCSTALRLVFSNDWFLRLPGKWYPALPVTLATALLLVLNVLSPRVSAGQNLPEESPESQLRAAAQGYLSNRESFDRFVCRYRIRVGLSRTVADALNGTLSKVTATADATWAVDGSKVLFDIRCEDGVIRKAFRENASPQGVSIPLPSNALLDDGSYQLYFSPVGQTAVIQDLQLRRSLIEMTPFDRGIMGQDESQSPPRLIETYLRDKLFCRVDLAEEEELKGCLCLRFGQSENRLHEVHYLDPYRGFLPVQSSIYRPNSTELLCKIFLTAARKCSGDRWFPERSIYVQNPGQPNGPYFTREIQVLHLDADVLPAESFFSLLLPKGTILNDGTRLGSQIILDKEERFSLRNLPALFQRTQTHADEEEKELAGQNRRHGETGVLWIRLFLAVNVLVVAWLLARVYLRWRRSLRGGAAKPSNT
jgi:hypothetical protein